MHAADLPIGGQACLLPAAGTGTQLRAAATFAFAFVLC
jgi:hypothetical protein